MNRLLIFSIGVVLLGGVTMLVWWYGGDDEVEVSAPTTLPTSDTSVSQDFDPYMQGASGNRVSAKGLVEHPQATELSDGFYQVTTDPDRYDIFYNDGNKNIFILLYEEPLAFTRSLAEAELVAALQVDESTLCDLGVQVRTNEYVNRQYAAYNLGLSFCSGSVTLDGV